MSAVSDAQALYTDALDALRDQRRQIEEDLRFSDPSDPQQWDEALKQKRETDPGGRRPCLTFDQTGQYVENVAGQVQQQPPAMHALPVGGGADKRVAEQLDGHFRHIEHASRAQAHYVRALRSAARAGVGYLILRPEYINRALNWQEPRISSEGDPLRVVLDPWSVELDGSDATFGYLLTPFSHRAFEAKFGKKAGKVSFGDTGGRTVDERESVLVAEHWCIETEQRSMILCESETGDEMALSEDDYWAACQRLGVQLPVYDTFTDKVQVVKWSRMSGADVLDKETTYPASGIGIVPVYGYVGWSDGRMHYCGIARRARAPQQAYNLAQSEIHQMISQAPKSPWIIPERAVRNHKALWDRASVDNRAFLPYDDLDDEGAISAPQRTPNATNLANYSQQAQQALHDIQASLGMYQASLGAPSNESSGVAIEARKQQGEAATTHFPAHLAASIGQIGRLTVEMLPKLLDKRREVRILGIDNAPGVVTVDPKQSRPLVEMEDGTLSINPNIGAYDVRVVVGASFSTQRSQAQTAYTEMMRANPALTPALAPLWAQTLDVPHADKLAQVLTAVAPPEVRAILSPDADKQPKVADLMAQLQQSQAALQEAIQHAKDAQAEADELRAENEAREDENAIKAYEAMTKRAAALKDAITPDQVQMLVVQTLERMMSQPDPMEEPADPGELPEGMSGMPEPDEYEQEQQPPAGIAPGMAPM